jgi:spherulation-specific family 4 protein
MYRRLVPLFAVLLAAVAAVYAFSPAAGASVMKHKPATQVKPAAQAGNPVHITTTLYTDPGDSQWSQVEAAGGTVNYAIVNWCSTDGSGPGCGSDWTSEPAGSAATVSALEAQGITPLVYLDTAYGAASTATLENEINQARSWWGSNISFHFDEGSTSCSDVSYYQGLYNYVHADGGKVMVNFGTSIPECYVDGTTPAADLYNVFEGTEPDFQGTNFASEMPWMSSFPSSEFSATVYQGASGGTGLATDFTDAQNAGIGQLYVNDETQASGPDYGTLPAFWSQEVSDAAATITTPPPSCAPITITAGGTYSGCYTSTDVNTPAVAIDTSAPVTITNSVITAAGIGIWGGASPQPDLTVTGTTFTATDPGSAPVHQQAIYLDAPTAATIQNDEFDDGQGILINGEGGTVSPLAVDYNNFENIGKFNESDWLAGAVHTDNLTAPGGTIDWNRVTDHYGSSVVEDVFGLVQTSGTAASPIDVGHDLVNGAYPYSGDGTDYSGTAFDTPDVSGSYINTHDDTAVNYAGSGFAADTGSHVHFTNDTAITDGIADDGTTRVSVSYGDGFTTWNNSDYGSSGPDLYVANSTAGHLRWNGTAWERADFYLPVCDPAGSCTGDTSISTVNAAAENSAVAAYESSVTSAGVTIGDSGTPPPANQPTVLNGPGYVTNVNSGLALDVTSGNYAGGVLQQWAKGAKSPSGVAGGDQQFEIVSEGGSDYLVAVNGTTDYYVTSSNKGSQLTLSSVPSADSVMTKSGPYYEFPNTGFVMDVKGASKSNGGIVDGWPLNNGTNQQWSLP